MAKVVSIVETRSDLEAKKSLKTLREARKVPKSSVARVLVLRSAGRRFWGPKLAIFCATGSNLTVNLPKGAARVELSEEVVWGAHNF